MYTCVHDMWQGISWGVRPGWPSSAATMGLPCILPSQRRPAAARPQRRHVQPRAPRPAGLAHRLTNFGLFPVLAADLLTKSRFASTLDSEYLKSNLVIAVPAWEPLGSRFEGMNRLSLYHRSNLNLSLTLTRHFPKEDKGVSQMARWGKVFEIWAPFLGPM